MGAALAAALTLPGPAAAQDGPSPSAPSVPVPPVPDRWTALAPPPAGPALAGAAARPLPRYDPWLGAVRLRVVEGPAGRARPPEPVAVDVEAWTALLVDRGLERLLAGARPAAVRAAPPPGSRDPTDPLALVLGEGASLAVSGRLHLAAVGSRSRRHPDVRSALDRRRSDGFDLDLDQVLDLDVDGTVGERFDVAVDFDSSRELEAQQLVSATYTGGEGEILRRVDVGDLEIALPPSRFLGPGVARGAFGVQALARVGPVDVRVLGSRREGRSTERRLTIAPRGDGVVDEVVLEIKDTEYVDGRFFLLFHPDSLADRRLRWPDPGTAPADPGAAPAPGSLRVWLDDGRTTNDRERGSLPGVARVDPDDPAVRAREAHEGFFDLLVEGEDYVVTDGVVLQTRRRIEDHEVLAVSYVRRSGEPVGSRPGADRLTLRVVKPLHPDTSDHTWDQALRNVYSLREPEIDVRSLSLEVFRGSRELRRTFETVRGETRKYTDLLGVTDAAGRVAASRILRDPFGGPDRLVFPDHRPFAEPTDGTGEPMALEAPNHGLYADDRRRTTLQDQRYFIEAVFLSRGGPRAEVELGSANLIAGSESITIGGETLVRGRDYQILYDLGKVVFLDPAELAERHPDAPIDIRFEVAPLFHLAPSSLWGAAGSWRVAEGAEIHSTVLVQGSDTPARRPILGAEPSRTAIAQAGGTWDSPAPFLTRWLDALPGVETDAESSLTLGGEVAFSRPDPNTAGRAWLHDFEDAKIGRPVQLAHREWRAGGVPAGTVLDPYEAAGARWIDVAVDGRAISPETRGVDGGESVLVVRLEPRGDTPAERRRSWRSIQTVLSPAGEDVTRQEFIEFAVRGDVGTLLVDLGSVDEDAVRLDVRGLPAGLGRLDTEETDPDARDDRLDVGEDVGLDGVAGDDGAIVQGDDGTDDRDERLVGGFPANPNGTEGNAVLDTEDVDRDGVLDRREDLLRWLVDLAGSPHEVPGSRTATGFRRIRLPLASPDAGVGDPDPRRVRVLRLAFTGLEETTDVEIAGLEIVGSTFLERGIAAADGSPLEGPDGDALRVSAVDAVENPAYSSPPGVEPLRDGRGIGEGGRLRERSLELAYDGLPAGARGAVYRPLFDRESYLDYGEMRIWVQGRPEGGGPGPAFFVAFGVDTLNVYEYGAPLAPGEWEEHAIDLAVFTELKRALLDSLAGSGGSTGTRSSPDGRYRVRIADPTAPPPTLGEVGQLTIGVENPAAALASGAIWVDEWRLAGPVREGGAATRLHAAARLADVADVAVTWEGRGARYRDLGAGRADLARGALDVSARLRLDRFLPSTGGVALPLTWVHRGRDATPLYRTGSDILLAAASRDVETRSDARDVVTLRAYREGASSNPFLAATLDRLEARLTWRSESTGALDLDTERGRWDFAVGYRNVFAERSVPLGLGWVERLPWPKAIRESGAIRRLASATLNLAPASVRLGTGSVLERGRRDRTLGDAVDATADTTRTLSADARVTLRPFRSMRLDVGWDATRDLVFPQTVVSRGTLGVEASRAHEVGFEWSPPVAGWLVPRYRYASRFSRDHTRETSRALDSLDLRDFAVVADENLTLELSPTRLVEALGGSAGGWWRRVTEPVRLDVRRREEVVFEQEPGDPGFGFTLGFGDLTGDVEGVPRLVRASDVVSVSTGWTIVSGLRLGAGFRSAEELRRHREAASVTSSRTWPDVELRWSAVEPPALLRPLVARLSVGSDFERRTTTDRADDRLREEGDRRLWDPLLGISVRWANGVTTELRASTSATTTRFARGDALDVRREERSADLVLDLAYDVLPGSRVYIPLPALWGATLERPLRTALRVAHRRRDDRTIADDRAGAALNLDTVTTEIRPSLSYEVGRIVSGFALSWLSRRDEKRDLTDTTTSMEAYLDLLF